MRTFFTLSLLLLTATAASAELVVLAASRDGRIDVFNGGLGPLGSVGVSHLLESVTASPDGRTLFLAQENPRTHACCSLYSLDVETHQMCLRVPQALFGVLSPDGKALFTQGTQGIDRFDPAAWNSNSRITMRATGAYNLQPSPDGRWLLGITNSPSPSLDIFDLESRELARRLPIPTGPATGAWAGEHYYIFSYAGPGKGQLWKVNPEDEALHPPKTIALPDFHGACNEPLLLMLAGAGDRLFLAEAFGFKMDRRSACPDAAPGGIYVIQPSSGQVGLIRESVHVNRMVVTPDGRDLYVIDSGRSSYAGEVRLMHIDATTGRGSGHVDLTPGDWNLSLAHVPPGLIVRGYVRAALSCTR